MISILWLLKKTSSQLEIDGYSGLIRKWYAGSEDAKYASKYSDSQFLT